MYVLYITVFFKLTFLDTTVWIKLFHMNTSFIKNPYIYINKKSPRGIRPRRCSPPPPARGVKYVTVTQDKSPCLCSERHDEYFFGRAKTGGLGQVTPPPPKKKTRKKIGITRPRPDGGVIILHIFHYKWLFTFETSFSKLNFKANIIKKCFVIK